MQVYEGNQPYTFVSYSHRDSQLVVPIIEQLESRGFRIWFDPGIEPGMDWPDYIAGHIDSCTVFLAFISGSASASPNCRQEVHRAIQKNKDIIVVYLDNSEITPGLEMQLARIQSMMLWNFASLNDLAEAISNTRPMQYCRGDGPARPVEPTTPYQGYGHVAQPAAPTRSPTKHRTIIAIVAIALAAVGVVTAVAVAAALWQGGRSVTSVQPSSETGASTEAMSSTAAMSSTEAKPAAEERNPAIDVYSSEVISYSLTGYKQTPTADKNKKEPATLLDAFSLLTFVKNTSDDPVMITSTELVAEKVDPVIQPEMRVEAIVVGDELLVYAVNDGWGFYAGDEIELLGSATNASEKKPLSECFDSQMENRAQPFGSGIVRLIGRYRIDIDRYKSIAHVVEPERKTATFNYDWSYELYADIPGFNTDDIGVLVCDSDDNLSVAYTGRGSGPEAAVELFAVLDVDSGPCRISFTSADSTPRIEDVFRIETTIAPTKSCSIRCKGEFTIGDATYETESHDVIVIVPIYEYKAIAGRVDGGCGMTRELAANLDASEAEIQRIADKYRYQPESLGKTIRSS